jgi:hypothetical protein
MVVPFETMMEENLVKTKTKPRRLLMSILTFIFMAVVCFFVESHAYFDSGRRVAMNDLEYVFFFLGTLLTMAAYLWAAFRFYKVKPHFLILLFALVFFVDAAIGIFFYQGFYVGGQLVYLATLKEDFRYLGNVFVEAFGVYVVFAIMPQVIRGSYPFRLFFQAFVLLIFGAILYSFVAEWSIYQYIFANGSFENAYTVPKSFTTNRNIYGMMLFLGIVSEAYLISYRPRFWRWLIILFFSFNLFMTLSKTACAVGFFFIPCFFIYRFFCTLRLHKKRNIIVGCSVLAFAVLIVVLNLLNVIATALPKLDTFFRSALELMSESAPTSFEVRVEQWAIVYAELAKSPETLIFGFGDYNFQKVLDALFQIPSTQAFAPLDSSYVTVLAKFGYFGIVLYAGILVFLYYYIIKSILAKSRAWFYYLLTFFCIAAFSVTESHLFLGFNSQSLMLFMVLVLPLLNENTLRAHPEAEAADVAAGTLDETIDFSKVASSDVIRISYFVLMPLFSLLFVLAYCAAPLFGFSGYASVPTLCSLVLFFVFLPLLIGGLFRLRKKNRPLFFVLLPFSVGYGVFTAVAPLLSGDDQFVYAGMTLGVVLFLFLLCSRNLLHIAEILRISWPYLGLFIALQSLMVILSHFFPDQLTPTLMVAYLGLDIVVWLFFFVVVPPDQTEDWLLLALWDAFEIRQCRHVNKREYQDKKYWKRQVKETPVEPA